MKKFIKLSVISMVFMPLLSLAANESVRNNQGMAAHQSFLIAANDNAELQPAEAEKNNQTENSAEEAKPAEEKKESKIGFIVGVAVMVIFMVVILMKTKGIEK